jgi:tRNA G18 (ribose-2'-O)-methylase SpoU
MDNFREKTRRQRYNQKKDKAKIYPIDIACINFGRPGNVGYVIRAAACFGARSVHVIGSLPNRKLVNEISGSLYDYITIIQHKNPIEFLDYARHHKIKLISAELVDSATSIDCYNFSFDSNICLVVGQEEYGIPVEILNNSDKVYIPMPGVGYCLNTSQTANIILYESVKRYENQQRHIKRWTEEKEIYCLP